MRRAPVRSIIFTDGACDRCSDASGGGIFDKKKLDRGLMVLTACALLIGPVSAGPKITNGCFMRDYSAAHLAKNPNQVVDWIRLKVFQDAYDDTVADLDVIFADQGHAAGSEFAGRVTGQVLHCWESNGAVGCSVDCDGGSFIVRRDDGDVLVFETEGLMLGDTESCGGAITLAEEVGKPVRYRLNRVDDAACEGN